MLPTIRNGITPTILVNFTLIALTNPIADIMASTMVSTPANPSITRFAMLVEDKNDEEEAKEA